MVIFFHTRLDYIKSGLKNETIIIRPALASGPHLYRTSPDVVLVINSGSRRLVLLVVLTLTRIKEKYRALAYFLEKYETYHQKHIGIDFYEQKNIGIDTKYDNDNSFWPKKIHEFSPK